MSIKYSVCLIRGAGKNMDLLYEAAKVEITAGNLAD
jgi:hypothetical protein